MTGSLVWLMTLLVATALSFWRFGNSVLREDQSRYLIVVGFSVTVAITTRS